jgi:hypothetical protein
MEMERIHMTEENKELDIVKQKNNKVLCAVSNPKIKKFRSWFLNNFLGRLNKKDKGRNEVRVNWLMTLKENEIDLLRDKSCKVIKLSEEIEIDTSKKEKLSDEYRKGCHTLMTLFERAMEKPEVKKEIRVLLTNKDGQPSKRYKIIMKTKKLLGE